MILVDISVWIDHLRNGDPALVELLERGQVVTHPFVLGELALGNLLHRAEVLNSLADLPGVTVASDGEVLGFIETAKLHGLGIGYINAHLLTATRLTPGASLWTRDKRLRAAAETIGLASYDGL